MRVKFSFSSHDSPEVLRLAGSFLTTLSDLTTQEHEPILTETLRQMMDNAPVAPGRSACKKEARCQDCGGACPASAVRACTGDELDSTF